MFEFDYKPKSQDMPVLNTKTREIEVDKKGVPKIEKREAIFSGTLRLKAPKHAERMRMVKLMNIGIKDGEAEADSDVSHFDRLISLAEFAMKYILKVELTRDGVEFKDKEILSCDVDGAQLIYEVGRHLMSEVRLGES